MFIFFLKKAFAPTPAANFSPSIDAAVHSSAASPSQEPAPFRGTLLSPGRELERIALLVFVAIAVGREPSIFSTS
jgi:hypothetical protein